MDSFELMAQFIVLWDAVQQIQLTDRPDEIVWRWSANGTYTSKSAYLAQMRGTFCNFDAQAIWHAPTEEKHRFFSWLLVKEKILTADKLLARNWPCESNCVLCDQVTEIAAHLCLQCPFAKQVWLLVNSWTNGVIPLPIDLDVHVDAWWRRSLSPLNAAQKRYVAAILMYTCWNLWKERNRRIFEQKSMNPHQVVQLIKEEVNLRRVACRTPEVF